MKKFLLLLTLLLGSSCVQAESSSRYIYYCVLWPSEEKPEMAIRYRAFEVFENQACGLVHDENNIVRTERGISLDKALLIAYKDPEIEYLMYIKAEQMEMFGKEGETLVLKPGDALFFKSTGEITLTSSKGIADTYLKVK